MENDWIDIKERMPEFTGSEDVRGGEKSTAIVEVKYNDGTTGEGLYRDNYYRASWMTREGSVGFLFNRAWGGVLVTHWRPKA